MKIFFQNIHIYVEWSSILKVVKKWAILEKIQTGEGVGVEDMEYLVVYTEEKAYGNSRGQLKKK